MTVDIPVDARWIGRLLQSRIGRKGYGTTSVQDHYPIQKVKRDRAGLPQWICCSCYDKWYLWPFCAVGTRDWPFRARDRPRNNAPVVLRMVSDRHQRKGVDRFPEMWCFGDNAGREEDIEDPGCQEDADCRLFSVWYARSHQHQLLHYPISHRMRIVLAIIRVPRSWLPAIARLECGVGECRHVPDTRRPRLM